MGMTTENKLEKIKHNRKLWIENFVHIADNKNDLIKFKLNEQQDEFLTKMGKFNIISKSRQIGFSTLSLAYCLFQAHTNPNSNYLILSYKNDSSSALFEKVKSMNRMLPKNKYKNYFASVHRENRNELLLSNGSRITCQVAGNKDVGRGSTFQYILLSEFAFYSNQEKVLLSCEQSLAKNESSKVVIESTSNGIGNFYYRLFKTAWKGNSKYQAFFYPFFSSGLSKQFKSILDEAERWHLSYYGDRLRKKDLEEDEKQLQELGANLRFLMFRRYLLMDMTEDEFAQEYPAHYMQSFVSSHVGVFSQSHILQRMDYIKEPKTMKEVKQSDIPKVLQKYLRKSLFIYDFPQKSMKHYAGVDTATGSGSDFSTITIINEENEEVATFMSNKVPVYEFADIVDALGKWYGYAFLAVERNHVGLPLIERLRQDKGYANMLKQKIFDQKGKKKLQLGWQTTQQNKAIMIQDFKESFELNHILLHNKETLEQMQIFVESDSRGKMGNAGDNHDDLVISAALAVQAKKQGKWYV
ncbi:terminase large subunit domain-containing protein [Salibacterium qingdaonense]|uniref:Terminase-like family protein n=1 Tax=Salibacterium qingdaonense TaxID=266892 RepID=A0A1I4QMN5_9BACI|nr:terminase family protein [Salibacterium qingdaonense]SFM41289.1 Terminase-like family protein [Salibacterium qingdaonense]